MSLIIARMVDGLPCFFGDTKLSFLYSDSKPFLDGCLKQYIITPEIAIGFAGEKYDFEIELPHFLSSTSLEEIVNIATLSQLQGGDFELVVADVKRSLFTFIKNGGSYDAVAGYVGCNAAFSQFQENMNQDVASDEAQHEPGKADLLILKVPPSGDSLNTFLRIYKALKLVIDDLQFPSVGGIVVPLCVDNGSFRYMNYVDRHSAILDFSDSVVGCEIDFGSAITGGCCVEFWDNSIAGGSGHDVGFYFLQGGIGVAFPRRISGLREAVLVKAENPLDWILETRRLYGTAVYSAYLDEIHCSVGGRRFIEMGDFTNALYCYELRKDTAVFPGGGSFNDQFAAEYLVTLFNAGHRAEAMHLLSEIAAQRADARICMELLQEMQSVQ